LRGGSPARVVVCSSLGHHSTSGTTVSIVAGRVFEWKSTGGRQMDGSGGSAAESGVAIGSCRCEKMFPSAGFAEVNLCPIS
jgi:hypothetical protein